MFTPFPPSLFSANEKKMRTYYQNGNPSDDYTLVSSGVTGCWGDIWIYDGPRTTWYANGQLRSSVQYEYGRLEGQQVEWYKNGQKKGEYNFKKGKADGFTTIWYENGQKKVEGICTNGVHRWSVVRMVEGWKATLWEDLQGWEARRCAYMVLWRRTEKV